MIDRIRELIFIIPAIVISLSVHEFLHAIVAYKMGDHSQKDSGRLSLNPLKHIDPIGFFMLIFFSFGWAKPVVYDPRNIEKKNLGRVLISLAGPFSNLLMGISFTLILSALTKNEAFIIKTYDKSIEQFIFYLVLYLSYINFGLAVFNIIPIPPLDGSHLLSVFFNFNYEQEEKFRRYGMPILLILIFSDRLIGIDLLPIGGIIQSLFDFFMQI